MIQNQLIPERTQDGSFTFFSSRFGEWFHSLQGAREEAVRKFVEPTQLASKATNETLYLLDVCYGLGYNTAAALESIWHHNPYCQIVWAGLELDPEVPRAAIAHQYHQNWAAPISDYLVELAVNHCVQTDRLQAILHMGDARQSIQGLCQDEFQADAIFLDPFSPPHCPQLWTVEFLQAVAGCLKSNGRLASYSCSAAFRTALMEAGLKFGPTPAVGRKSPGTVASFSEHDLPVVSNQEQEHLQTRAAVPYRDPSLQDDALKILDRRQREQMSSTFEPTSRWKKRWAGKSELY